MLAFLAARAIPGLEVVTRDGYARTIEIDGAHGIVSVRPRQAERAARRRCGFPKLSALPAIIARAAPRVRSRRRSAAPSARSSRRTRARAAGRGAPGSARARRLGRLRAGGARRARPADHRRRRDARSPASWSRSTASRSSRSRDRGLTHVFPRPARLAGANLAALGMPKARARRPVRRSRPRSTADPASSRCGGSSRQPSHGCAARPASASGPRNTSRCAQLREPDAFPAADIGLAPRDGRPPRAPADARGAAGARGTLAAVARLRRAIPVDGHTIGEPRPSRGVIRLPRGSRLLSPGIAEESARCVD